jgi:hypothetical protein
MDGLKCGGRQIVNCELPTDWQQATFEGLDGVVQLAFKPSLWRF